MSKVSIQLPDQSTRFFDHSPTGVELAYSLGQSLGRSTVGVQINGDPQVLDLRTPLNDKDQVRIVTAQSPQGLEVLRHSGAHVLAQAVWELFPKVQITIGPVVEGGFYYDFALSTPFSNADLERIEKRMKEIIKQKIPIEREVWSQEKALEFFHQLGQTYKMEIIKDLGHKEVSVYRQGDWLDLCRGPHVQHTGQVGCVKVLSVAGAYWRGNSDNEQLQRVYATAFHSSKELKEFLDLQAQAQERDHRKVGKQLGLFMFHDWSGGMPFFTSKGSIIYNELIQYIREVYKRQGYQEVITPQIFDPELFKRSGHYENYRENMYFTEAGGKTPMALKPMNCPAHCLLYASTRYSYRDLPLRLADFGRLHRYEASGALNGLTRVRSMCQDDGHIFCRRDQVQSEIVGFMNMLKEVYGVLGLNNYKIYLSTRPEKSMGEAKLWAQAEEDLEQGLRHLGLDFEVSPGDGAFYGPKVEIHFIDTMKRTWQLGTLQLDFFMPQEFKLKYIGEDNRESVPVLLHRAILGTLERFIGIYIEQCGGRFPLWLSPIQVSVLNVTDRQESFCQGLKSQLKQREIRVNWDHRSEKLGYKIREAQLQKVPYMVIVGDREVEGGQISVRLPNGSMSDLMRPQDLVEILEKEVRVRSLKPLIQPSKKAFKKVKKSKQ